MQKLLFLLFIVYQASANPLIKMHKRNMEAFSYKHDKEIPKELLFISGTGWAIFFALTGYSVYKKISLSRNSQYQNLDKRLNVLNQRVQEIIQKSANELSMNQSIKIINDLDEVIGCVKNMSSGDKKMIKEDAPFFVSRLESKYPGLKLETLRYVRDGFNNRCCSLIAVKAYYNLVYKSKTQEGVIPRNWHFFWRSFQSECFKVSINLANIEKVNGINFYYQRLFPFINFCLNRQQYGSDFAKEFLCYDHFVSLYTDVSFKDSVSEFNQSILDVSSEGQYFFKKKSEVEYFSSSNDIFYGLLLYPNDCFTSNFKNLRPHQSSLIQVDAYVVPKIFKSIVEYYRNA
jgi:hypothetical protein